MPEKLTLTVYLERKGQKAKALKRVEAEAFGIPYPLQAGWPARHGAMEITQAMIERIANSPRRRDKLQSVKEVLSQGRLELLPASAAVPSVSAGESPVRRSPKVPGFALRSPKRAKPRRPAPWA